MIALYLIAAHMVGDYLLQTRWQAMGKFDDWRLRAKHVATYTLCFVPIAVAYSSHVSSAVTFLVALAVLHFATDSRRFLSTPGDVIASRRPPPNPWAPMPILIDQSLHVVQIALLAGIILR